MNISKDLPVPSRTTTQEVADWGIAECDIDVGVVGDVGIRPGVDLAIKTIYFVCFFYGINYGITIYGAFSKAKFDEGLILGGPNWIC